MKLAALLLVGCVMWAAPASSPAQQPIVKSPPDTTAPDIPGVVAWGTRVQLIRDLFQSTEGPIAMPDGSLLFTEQDAGDGALVRIDKRTLYVVGRGAVWKIAMIAQGYLGRAK